MDGPPYLTGQLLLALPGMGDPRFTRAVIAMCAHDEDGALGIVVNRVRARSIEQAYRLEELQSLYGPLLLTPAIPERAALQQSQGAARPIHSWPGPAAAELAGAAELVRRSISS